MIGKALRRLILAVVGWWATIGFRLVMRRSRVVRSQGFNIYDVGGDASAGNPSAGHSENTVREALALLTQKSPAHVRWLRRTVKHIILTPDLPADVALMPKQRMLAVQRDLAVQYPAETVAVHMISEATRARYWLAGVRGDRMHDARLVHRGAMHMLAFVEGTPSAQYMKEWAEAAVRMSQDSATIEAGRLVFDLERQELLSGKALPARVVQWLQDVRRKEQ